MTEDEATHRLGEALNHFHASAATFNAGNCVNEESALTAYDSTLTLTMLERVHSNAKGTPER
jgi:hypothetical protein